MIQKIKNWFSKKPQDISEDRLFLSSTQPLPIYISIDIEKIDDVYIYNGIIDEKNIVNIIEVIVDYYYENNNGYDILVSPDNFYNFVKDFNSKNLYCPTNLEDFYEGMYYPTPDTHVFVRKCSYIPNNQIIYCNHIQYIRDKKLNELLK